MNKDIIKIIQLMVGSVKDIKNTKVSDLIKWTYTIAIKLIALAIILWILSLHISFH